MKLNSVAQVTDRMVETGQLETVLKGKLAPRMKQISTFQCTDAAAQKSVELQIGHPQVS
jgi:hypothetical protein